MGQATCPRSIVGAEIKAQRVLSLSPQACQGHARRRQASPLGPKVGRTRLRGRWPGQRGHGGAFPERRGGSPTNGAQGPRVHLRSEGETASLREGMDPCVGWGPLNTLSMQPRGPDELRGEHREQVLESTRSSVGSSMSFEMAGRPGGVGRSSHPPALPDLRACA